MSGYLKEGARFMVSIHGDEERLATDMAGRRFYPDLRWELTVRVHVHPRSTSKWSP